MCEVKKALSARPVFMWGIVLVVCIVIYVNLFYTSPTLPFQSGEYITLRGIIENKSLNSDGNIATLYLKGHPGFLCYVNNSFLSPADYPIGAEVIIKGKVGLFDKARNPGEFNSKDYYENRGYFCYVNLSDIVVPVKPSIPVREFLFSLRMYFCDVVLKACPLEGGTINTLLFGDKTGLDSMRKELYKNAGLSHFLVISGLHVSVAGGGIYIALKKTGMKRKYAAWAGLLFVLFYGALVGFSVSVMRAVIMFIIRLLADILNRTYDILTALFTAAIITLIQNPLWIRDSAFLYSYLAVLFIGLYYTFLRQGQEFRVFRHVVKHHGFRYRIAKIKMAVSVPILIYLALLPVSLYFQCYSNLLSVPLNLILGLFTAPILYCGAFGLFCGLMHMGFLAKMWDFLCTLMLRIIDRLSHFVAVSGWTKIINKPTLAAIIIYYVIFFLFLFIMAGRVNSAFCVLMVTADIMLVGINLNPCMAITMVDVGQGDCIIIKTSIDSAIICDCGSSDENDVGKYTLVPTLMSMGIRRITDLYVSHYDSDHINGLTYLLENMAETSIYVSRIVLPGLPPESLGSEAVSLYRTIRTAEIPAIFINAGDTVSYPGFSVKCLWPDADYILGDSNSDSMVLWLKAGDFDMLLSGDATVSTETRLIKSGLLQLQGSIEVYKCAHHGSNTSSSVQFLDLIDPRITLISVGAGNPYGHPRDETLEKLKKIGSTVYRTDLNGAINIYIHNKKLSVKTYLSLYEND